MRLRLLKLTEYLSNWNPHHRFFLKFTLICALLFFSLLFHFTARRRVGNTRGASNHSLQTLSTSDSTHSLSGDRYGRTSGGLNPQQSGVISRQPQASSSVPYIAHGTYSPYNINGDVNDPNRCYFVQCFD